MAKWSRGFSYLVAVWYFFLSISAGVGAFTICEKLGAGPDWGAIIGLLAFAAVAVPLDENLADHRRE